MFMWTRPGLAYLKDLSEKYFTKGHYFTICGSSDVPREFCFGGGGVRGVQKKVANFTFLTYYFSIENSLTMKYIIVYTLNDNK